MSLLDGTADVLGRDVGVDRGRLDARVAEELLDVAHVGAVLQEMRRAAVAERVGGHPHRDAGGLGVAANEVLDALDRKPCAAVRQEEGPLAGVVDELGAGVPEVDVEGGRGAAHDGKDAVLPPFAEPDEELAADKIHVPELVAPGAPLARLRSGLLAQEPAQGRMANAGGATTGGDRMDHPIIGKLRPSKTDHTTQPGPSPPAP